MATDLILGTAGHIDHGKTALVKALTGVDTDRLPEEKKRGITIELGYARLDLGDLRLGIVDVPGHERFVRNMLAGATGIDLAILVVAADDSVMPQTREHLDILRLLDLAAGVIVLTKCDLATPDWIDLVESEVRELVVGTFLAAAPIIRTSATTGEGIEPLRDAIAETANRMARPHPNRPENRSCQETSVRPAGSEAGATPFRMAIDRTFTITGHGTVVTGSVVSGSANVGDTLAVEPGGISVRVRGLQTHDVTAESVHRGQRAAINLAGIHHREIRRGQEVATPGYLRPSRLLTVQLDLLPSAPRVLKNRSRVRLHLGTADVMATVAIFRLRNPPPRSPKHGPKETTNGSSESATLPLDRHLSQGQSALAQLYLAEEVIATWRQPFVIRWPSPVETIGGGVVLQPNPRRLRPSEISAIEMANRLASDDATTRVAAAAYFAGLDEFSPLDQFRTSGVQETAPFLRSLVNDGTLVRLSEPRGGTLTVHSGVLESIGKRVSDVLRSLHRAEPLRRGFSVGDVGRIVAQSKPVEPYWSAIVDQLAAMGILEYQKNRTHIALVGAGPQLSRGEKALLDELTERIRQAGVEPPSVDELKADAAKNKASVVKLLELAAADGLLVKVNQAYWLHVETLDDVKATLRQALADGHGLTLSEIRGLLGTTRKYAVPLCERLDADRFTVRRGDQRFMAE